MTSDQFVFWLNGYFEISQHSDFSRSLNERQVEEIKNHLNLVLTKEAPLVSSTPSGQLDLFKDMLISPYVTNC